MDSMSLQCILDGTVRYCCLQKKQDAFIDIFTMGDMENAQITTTTLCHNHILKNFKNQIPRGNFVGNSALICENSE